MASSKYVKFRIGDQVMFDEAPAVHLLGKLVQPGDTGIVIAITTDGYTVKFDNKATGTITGLQDNHLKRW